MVTTVIKGGTIVTMDPDRRLLNNSSIVCRNGVIEEILPSDELAGRLVADHEIDASGCAVLPGFINGHTHGCMLFGRTIGTDREFPEWFGTTQLPMMAEMGVEEYTLAETLTMVENLLAGNTTVLENSFFPAHLGAERAPMIADAAQVTGIRAVIADAYLTGNSAALLLEDPDEAYSRQRRLLQRYHRTDRLTVALSPLLPWATSLEDLRATIDLAREYDVMVHAHCAETPHYNERCQQVHKARSNVAFHAEAGALGPQVQLVGCSEIDAEDIAMIADTGTRVISVPTSDLFQSHYPLQMAELLDRGVSVSLASNGCAGNGGQSMFAAMKDGAGLVKALHRDPSIVTKDVALEMATIGAARNLGLDTEVGSIEVGKRADIIAVDLSGAHVTPVLDVIAAVVYCCQPTDVLHVLVDGQPVVLDGRCVTIDVKQLVEDVNEAALTIARTNADIAALTRGLE